MDGVEIGELWRERGWAWTWFDKLHTWMVKN